MSIRKKTDRGLNRKPRIVISAESLEHLEGLAEGAMQRQPDLADRLLDELYRARIVPGDKLPENVVALGRVVVYRDEATGQEKAVTLVYPEEADISRDRISVLTPVGIALLGLTEGASFLWETRGGTTRSLTVLSVTETLKVHET